MKLSDKAVLAQLSISRWTARKFDRKATHQVAHVNSTNVDVGRYNKALLPSADLLADVTRKAADIRKRFYENTLPWGINGTQILPAKNYMAFMQDFRHEKSDYEYLVSRFVSAYPALQQDARRSLGSLYNSADYPHPADIAGKFSMDIAVFPIPSDDFRLSIADDELERIQLDVHSRVSKAAKDAMADVWQRLYDRVEHMANKLKDPDARFHASTVEHVVELCKILRRLNFDDDPNLEDMRREVDRNLLGPTQSVEVLRNSPTVREATADSAADIMSKMSAFMGGQ